ncbi:hypothetical protein WI666_07220 [Vibrio cholerae]
MEGSDDGPTAIAARNRQAGDWARRRPGRSLTTIVCYAIGGLNVAVTSRIGIAVFV